MRSPISIFFALALSTPALAGAQTLAVDAPDPAGAGPLDVVAQPPAPSAAAPIEAQPVEAQPTEPSREDAERVAGYSAIGFWAESIDLRSAGLTLAAPEVEALTGTHLDASWAGNAPLAQAVVGGVGIHVGMRAYELLRGPELRLMIGGGDVSGPWAPAPGAGNLELAIQSLFVVRLEAAIGLQVPLGPVVPYVLGRAGVGLAVADVSVRDASLGRLGTEHVDAGMLELGIEAGVAFRPAPGLELGVALRGSFLGTQSVGGALTLGFDGSTADE